MTEPFRIGYTKDFLNAKGEVGWGDIALGLYEGVPEIELSYLEKDERVLTAENAGDYDALGVLAPHTTAEFVDHAPRLAIVARFGVGYDTVDLDACTRNGIAVTNTPEGVRRAMSSTGMALMLALAHRIIQKDRITREGGWGRKLDFMGYGLTGRTLGTIGLGGIGRDFMGLAAPWGMRRIAFDPYVAPEQATALGVELADLDTVMRESDFVVIVCNLTAETRHLVNAERIALMKPTAFLINIARGPIVDEPALYEALRTHRIRGAALDVFEQEPVDPDNPLLQLDNVVLAPHALGWTDESAYGIGSGVATSILAVWRGEVPPNVVNREVIDSPRFQAKLATHRARWGAA
jgi:phosphoglycerate dehydrogenase-like enzyme